MTNTHKPSPLRGRKQTPEHIEARTAQLRGRPLSPETREKLRIAATGKKQSPETIEKRMAKLRGRKRSQSAIEASRLAKLGTTHSEEAKERMKAAQLAIHARPEWRDRQAIAQRARWADHRRRKKGYVAVYVPVDDPMRCMSPASWKGYVQEHRLIMARHIGRPLTKADQVHHINFVRDDNRIENLLLLTRSEHMRLHNLLRLEAWAAYRDAVVEASTSGPA